METRANEWTRAQLFCSQHPHQPCESPCAWVSQCEQFSCQTCFASDFSHLANTGTKYLCHFALWYWIDLIINYMILHIAHCKSCFNLIISWGCRLSLISKWLEVIQQPISPISSKTQFLTNTGHIRWLSTLFTSAVLENGDKSQDLLQQVDNVICSFLQTFLCGTLQSITITRSLLGAANLSWLQTPQGQF